MNTAPQPRDYPADVTPIAKDINEPIADETIITEETTEVVEPAEPEMWPVYLSLGALGLALLVFIALNLFGRKHRK